jgi:hypothetical protein
VRADADPADASTAVDNKGCTPREINRVDSYRLVNAICARHRSRFIKEDREAIRVFLDVFLSAKEPVDFLRGDKDDACVSFDEFLVSRLELSQLIRTIRSPGAADEHHYQRSSAVVCEADGRAIGC